VLLDMPARDTDMSDSQFEERLRAAADRAVQLFGPQYARTVFNEAWGFRNLAAGRRRQLAEGLTEYLPAFGFMGEDDLEQLRLLQDLSREEAAGRYGPATTMPPLPGLAGIGPPQRPVVPPAGRGAPASFSIPRTEPRRTRVVGPGLTTVGPTPTPEEIQYLQAHPQIWQLFDERFGDGASGFYIQPALGGAR
jgi:hypothetical protein